MRILESYICLIKLNIIPIPKVSDEMDGDNNKCDFKNIYNECNT